MDGEADGAPGVVDTPGDGLADPPGGVGGELETLAPVEFLHGVDQAEVAVLDEVEEGQTEGLVLLGDRDHEAEVGLHERALGQLPVGGSAPELPLLGGGQPDALLQLPSGGVATLDLLGEADLVILGEQGILADVGQVETDKIFFVSLDSISFQYLNKQIVPIPKPLNFLFFYSY